MVLPVPAAGARAPGRTRRKLRADLSLPTRLARGTRIPPGRIRARLVGRVPVVPSRSGRDGLRVGPDAVPEVL